MEGWSPANAEIGGPGYSAIRVISTPLRDLETVYVQERYHRKQMSRSIRHTEGEWETHRLLITQLCKGRNLRLTDIMELIDREHGFVAT